ncbi:MAG: S-layer homology domain-containing protein, partial [Clostridia bacterium]|nr:S-layer homology domain-containing protein [Clostridia bacterium]
EPEGGSRLYARYFNYSDRTWADEIFCLTDGTASVTDYSASLDDNTNLQAVVLAENPGNDGHAIYTVTVPYTADLSLDSAEYSGACYVDGCDLDLDLTLTNHGARSVSAYQLTVTDERGNAVLQDVRNQTVDPGQTITVTLPLKIEKAAANVRLHAVVTAAGVTDTDPGNDAFDFTLNREDLSLENLHWALREDGDAAVIGTVVNRGYGSYGSVTVTLRSGAPDGEILQTETLPGPDTLVAEGVSFVVPYEEDAVYYVRIEQEEADDRGGNDYDFVVLQSESRFTWGEAADTDCGGDMTVCPSAVFTDAPAYGNWAHNPIDWAVEKGITTGTSATTFSPEDGCTRGHVVTFLWRAAGSPEPAGTNNPFRDVRSGEYYYKAVLWAVGEGITLGTSKTAFSPDDVCTRGQIVTFLWRANGKPTPAKTNNPFKDVKPNDYFYDAVLWAVEKGVTLGTDASHFSPSDTCTRSQVVTFLYRAMKE